eukprot:4305147-Pyramimonas_sp.AAC.1
MCGKHVDDLKVGGESHMVQKLRTSLEAVFGKLKFSLKKFTNVGIRHVQHEDGTVETDQTEYVNAIQTIPPEVYSGQRGDEKCTEQQMSMLWSLVGALGYAMITQVHMLVYVVSLQRQQRDASIIHLRRANALVRHMQ